MVNDRSLFYGRFMVVAKLESSFRDDNGRLVEYAEMTLSTGKQTIKANVMADNEAYACEFGKWYNFEMQANNATKGNSSYTKYKINSIATDQEIVDYFGLNLGSLKSSQKENKEPFK